MWPACRAQFHRLLSCLQVMTMVTVAFALVSAMSGLMGMNLYFAVTTFPLVSSTGGVQKQQGVAACHGMVHQLRAVPMPPCFDPIPR